MSSDDFPDENVIRERAAKRLSRFRRLIVHLGLTVVIALGLTFAIDQFRLPRVVEVVIPLAVLLFIAHAFWLMYVAARDRITEQEFERERQRRADRARAAVSKPKRAQHFSLSDDGELVQVDDSPEYEKTKRQGG